ncbi:MAG: DUF1285 domain-containing protein [Candidatus Rokubacteria bacterium]|nr:DUF1285 domain-containing protein [Candidatus Rokubacteria bacterium]
MREYSYTVDRDGRVFHDGSEIVDPATLRFFLLAMTTTPDGRHLVVCQGERNWFESADTPFVVQRVALVGPAAAPEAVELRFAGDYRERLDPATLESRAGVLYCRVRRGAFRARFGRVALQQLAPLLAERGDGPALVLAGASHPIRRRPSSGS